MVNKDPGPEFKTLYPSSNFNLKPTVSNAVGYFIVVESLAAAKSLQSCLTLCDPIDGSPPGSPIPGILQAKTLQWVAISFSNAWKWKVKVKSLSRVRLLATPWTVAHQAPLSMGFPRQEYWSGLPRPSPGDLPDPGIEPTSPALAGGFFYHWAIREARVILLYTHYSHFLKLGEIKQLSQCHTFMLESGSKLSLLYLIPKPQFLTIMF